MERLKVYITPEQYEIAERNGINKKNLEKRIREYKWPVERAVTEPVRVHNSKWLKIARENGIPENTYRSRLAYGWSKERASTQAVRGFEISIFKKEYALYKGEELLFVGNTIECANFLDVTPTTIQYYATASHRERIDDRTSTYAVSLDNDDVDIEHPENEWF